MATTPTLERSAYDLLRLVTEIEDFSVADLEKASASLPPALSTDFYQGKVPLFIQKLQALYLEKGKASKKAFLDRNFSLYRKNDVDRLGSDPGWLRPKGSAEIICERNRSGCHAQASRDL